MDFDKATNDVLFVLARLDKVGTAELGEMLQDTAQPIPSPPRGFWDRLTRGLRGNWAASTPHRVVTARIAEMIKTEELSAPEPTRSFQRSVQRAAIHVQSSGRDEVTGANVLVAMCSERQTHAVNILHAQDITRLDIVNFIAHGVSKVPVAGRPEPPPELPPQGIGPHVELSAEGIIGFPPAESVDQDGNHLDRLGALHPDLKELAAGLLDALGKGNTPHATLRDRTAAYFALIDRDLQTIDFRRLYAAGIRLANAAFATERAILIKELPPWNSLNAKS
jgi:hypothetical protein